MKMRGRVRSLVVAGALLLAGNLVIAETAGDDVSGIYTIREEQGWDGASLNVVSGGESIWLYFAGVFPFGETHNTCECMAQGKSEGPRSYSFFGEDSAIAGTLTFSDEGVAIAVTKEECCGVGGPGFPKFKAASREPLRPCTVKSEKAVFGDLDNKPTKAYVVKGDQVEVSESEPAWDTALARYVGKKPTIGRMKLEDLDCPQASKP